MALQPFHRRPAVVQRSEAKAALKSVAEQDVNCLLVLEHKQEGEQSGTAAIRASKSAMEQQSAIFYSLKAKGTLISYHSPY